MWLVYPVTPDDTRVTRRGVAALLAGSAVAPSVRAEFRNAQMQRQRIVGGTGSWDAALERWHAKRSASGARVPR